MLKYKQIKCRIMLQEDAKKGNVGLIAVSRNDTAY